MSNRLRAALTIAFAADAACGGVTIEREVPDGGSTGGVGSSASVMAAQGGGPIRRPPASGYCGDGIKNGDELCDRYDFGGETCQTATMSSSMNGSLRCTTRCTLDLSACTYASTGGRFGTAGALGIGGTMGAGGRGSGGTGGAPANTGGTSPSTGGTDAGSIGDPHVLTLDGLKYDFQAVGEFILLEDKEDSRFVIQVRQAPFFGLSTMSVNTAVAASVAGDRVAFYAGADPAVRIDGTPTRVTESIGLPHGGTLANDAGTYTLTWPTGEALLVVTTWKTLVNVNYRPSATRRRKVRGLLGTHDSVTNNDLTTRSGKTLRVPSRPEDLYRVFGQSYRIKDSESLFDYSPGEATATYTDRSFPLLHGTPPHPPSAEISRAQDVCAAAGVVDPHALEACAIDVAITGDKGFAKAAAARKQP
jgi:hypothetical protein